MIDPKLEELVILARMGFENDLHRIIDQLGITRTELSKRLGTTPAYVSKVLNGADSNYQLETMSKWAQAVGAIVQIRLAIDGKEAVRVVDYETAGQIDDRLMAKPAGSRSDETDLVAPVIDMGEYRERKVASGGAGFSYRYLPDASHG